MAITLYILKSKSTEFFQCPIIEQCRNLFAFASSGFIAVLSNLSYERYAKEILMQLKNVLFCKNYLELLPQDY